MDTKMIDFSKLEVFPDKMADKLQEFSNTIMRAVNKAKADWMDAVMQKVLPPELYVLSKTEKGKHADRKRLTKYFELHKIRLAEHLDHTAIMKGETVLSEFRFRMNGTIPECAIRHHFEN